MQGSRRQRGFTLIELIVTMAIAAILTVIAIPSFYHMVIGQRLDSQANNAIMVLQQAKGDAIRQGTWVQFCSDNATLNTTDTLGSACSAAGAVYAQTLDAQGNPQTTLLQTGWSLPSQIQISGSVNAVRFNGLGIAQAPGNTSPLTLTVVDFCSPALTQNNHRQVQIAAGTVFSIVTTTGSCP